MLHRISNSKTTNNFRVFASSKPSPMNSSATYRPQLPPTAALFRVCTHNARRSYLWTYKFSAKEKDTETGYSYFSSRYYSSDLSIWLSVDPKSDKYPSLSPYVYCANNPIKLVDPDGEEIWIIGEDGSRVKYTQGMTYDGQDKSILGKINTLNQMNSTRNGKRLLGELTTSNNIYSITDQSDDNLKNAHFCANDLVNGGTGGVIVTQGKNDLGTLSHELFHAYQDEKGQGGSSIHNEVEAMLFQTSVISEYVWKNPTAFPRSPLHGDNDKYNSIVDDLLKVFSSNSMKKVIGGFKDCSGANRGAVYDNYDLYRGNQPRDLIQDFYPLQPW